LLSSLEKIRSFFLDYFLPFFITVVCSRLGDEGETSRSWLDILGFSLQPSEFVKIFFLIFLAAWLEARRQDLNDCEMASDHSF